MQSAIKYFFKTVLTGLIVTFVIFMISVSLEYFFGRIVKLDANLAKEIGYYAIYGVTLTFVNSTWFDFLNKKVDWTRFEKIGKYRLIIGAFGSVVLTLCGIFIVRLFIRIIIEGHTFDYFIFNEKVAHYYVSLIITLIVSLVFHLIYFYKASQEKKVVEQKVIAGTATAKFESLKNQLDPHFLFNSLNVLSALIEENPENAQKFTTSLSKVYRYVLDQRDKELITVAGEIDFAKTYVKLLQMRFENAVHFELANDLINNQGFVVPLSLQLLLENCIKHNVVSDSKPLTIKIYIDNKTLIIENNLQIKESFSDRKGVGLENIVNRYALLTKRQVLIEKSTENYKVKIPILTKQIEFMDTQQHTTETIALLRAKDKLEKLKGFYANLASYLIVIPMLIFINLYVQKDYNTFKWFWFPTVFWGFGVAMHAFEVFGYGKKWEENLIRKYMKQ